MVCGHCVCARTARLPMAIWVGNQDILNMRMNGYDFHVNLMAGKEKWTDPKTQAVFAKWAELLPYFEADEQTRAIVISTEPGGRMEAQLSEWVSENDSRLPIVAFMAGKFMDDEEMKGMSFGHAGTIVEGAEDTATQKIARLEAAGIAVVERIDEIPAAVAERIGG